MAKKKTQSEAAPEPELYTTLGKAASAELIERRSVFIGSASPVKTQEEAIAFVNSVRARYPDATHNVYAYIIGRNVTRYSDDGEPSGTAGMPVFDVIRKSGLTDAAIVVTRYFGGILLGAGGLVRAYAASAKSAVDAAEIVTYESFVEFTLLVGYADYQKVEPELAKYGVKREGSDFGGEVGLSLAIKKAVYDDFAIRVTELTAARAIFTPTGERFDR